MYIIPPKYRGSTQYEQTKKVLIEAARNGICISYKIIWDILGLKPGSNAVRHWFRLVSLENIRSMNFSL
jgi:hypothetical protein